MVNTDNIIIQKLWHEYAMGDNDPLNGLYKYYKKPLLLVAYKYLRCEKTSEDIVADTFERLIFLEKEGRAQLVNALSTNPMAYLTIIVKNKSLDNLRKVNSRKKIIETIKHTLTSKISNEANISFTNDGLAVMMNYLEPREKEIIQLHLTGYSNEEIAQKLNLKYTTVKNNIYEAKLKLRRMWQCMM